MLPMNVARRAGAACGIAVLAATAGLAGASAQTREGAPVLVQQFGDWTVYRGSVGGRKVCFALSRPTTAETDPPGRPRDPVYLFIAARPADGVRAEVSMMLGYAHKAGADVMADIGGTSFALQTQRDNAWMRSSADDERLVEAMRRGSDMVVKGVSVRGTQTTDRYSLRGLAQSLDRVRQECS
jgi:invasion protein IalB